MACCASQGQCAVCDADGHAQEARRALSGIHVQEPHALQQRRPLLTCEHRHGAGRGRRVVDGSHVHGAHLRRTDQVGTSRRLHAQLVPAVVVRGTHVQRPSQRGVQRRHQAPELEHTRGGQRLLLVLIIRREHNCSTDAGL